MNLPSSDMSEFLRPLVTGWTSKIEAAKKSDARKRWEDVAGECEKFYSGKTGFMWDAKNGSQFWEGIPAPRFRLTLTKAFELVAIFAPTLLYNIPHRRVEAKRALELPMQLFQMDPNLAQFAQQGMMQTALEAMQDNAVASMLEAWLNYTPREMPGGGLIWHAERAITDALIVGRGCLWTRPYYMPGSGRTLTGCFRENPKDLIIDPDFPTLNDAKWICQRCIHPTWQVEREYGHAPGSLATKGSLESAWSVGERAGDPGGNMHRIAGKTNDLMVYYKIWSKTGPGTRLTGMNSDIKDHLEQVVGDHAYIVVAPDVPFPLNLSPKMLETATDADVQHAMSWPIPFWTDDRWPVTVVDFYPENDSPYPLPPLAPGLGELKFLNVMVSHLANRIWKSSRDFIAVAQSAMNEMRKHLEEGSDMTLFPISDIQGDISKVVQWLQQPQTNFDVWKIIDAVSDIFDKRVGLTELAYGLNPGGTQSRSAEESSTKRQAFSIRPESMAKKVEDWMSQAAASEAFCTRWFVEAKDVAPLLGPLGAVLWQQLVQSTDVEKVVRQMSYTVEAGSTRRPNKDRDVANANQAMQTLLPVFVQYGAGTQNFAPINSLIRQWGKASDIDTTEMMLQPPPPPPQPQVDPAQQEQEARQKELEMRQQEHEQKMRHDEETHAQRMQTQAQQAAMSRATSPPNKAA